MSIFIENNGLITAFEGEDVPKGFKKSTKAKFEKQKKDDLATEANARKKMSETASKRRAALSKLLEDS